MTRPRFGSNSASEAFQPILDKLESLHPLPTFNSELTVVRDTKLSPQSRGYRKSDATYNRDTKTITVRELPASQGNGPREAFHFLQEYGHAVDDGLSGTRNLNSMLARGGTDGMWKAQEEFRRAVMDSQPYKDLIADTQHPKYVQWATQPEQLWSRAYGQWSAERIGGDVLDGMNYVREKFPELQWREAEFAPIRAAVEQIMRERGLIGDLKPIETAVKKAVKKEVKTPVQKALGRRHLTTRRGPVVAIERGGKTARFKFNSARAAELFEPSLDRLASQVDLSAFGVRPVEINVRNIPGGATGQYFSGIRRVELQSNRGVGVTEETLYHELGHAIDDAMKQAYGYASESLVGDAMSQELVQAFDEFRAAVVASGRLDYTRLSRLLKDERYQAYLTSGREVWARAFSQYMIERVGLEPARALILSYARPNGYFQWSEADFASIAKAIEKVFKAAGIRIEV